MSDKIACYWRLGDKVVIRWENGERVTLSAFKIVDTVRHDRALFEGYTIDTYDTPYLGDP